MTIQEVLKKYPNIETDLLLSHVLRKPKEFLFLHPEYNLTTKQFSNLTKLVKRRQKGEPIAYILGYKYFCGLKFKVTKDVLIPRPETEWLVETAAQLVKSPSFTKASPFAKASGDRSASKGKSILDMGTGSGNIIISLATLIHGSIRPRYFASDISEKALNIAKFNAKKHKTKIKFIQSDLFENIKGKFDMIIANLPYVPKSDYRLMIKGLRYEPKPALTDGTDKFIIYEKFFKQIPKFLNPKSLVLIETDPASKDLLTKYIKKYLPSARYKFHKDLNKLLRYVEIKNV